MFGILLQSDTSDQSASQDLPDAFSSSLCQIESYEDLRSDLGPCKKVRLQESFW